MIIDAMKSYFLGLEKLYEDSFGTLPTVSWNSDLEQDLFVGAPDEDHEIQWKYKEATPLKLSGLCEELQDFFGSFYYWQLRGIFRDIEFCFPPIPSFPSAQKVASAALADGTYYFPDQDVVLLAACVERGNDDLLLFYRQGTGRLFLFDADKGSVAPQDYSLSELIRSMKAVL